MDKVMQAAYELMQALVADTLSPCYYNTGTPLATPHGVRAVFFGDPAVIPDKDFPAICIRPIGSQLRKGQSRYDEWVHELEIIVVENFKNYRETTPADPRKVQSLAQMLLMMEQTNTVESISLHTIVGTMRHNQLMPYVAGGPGNAAVQVNPQSVDYLFNVSRGFPTFEVIGKFQIISQGDRA